MDQTFARLAQTFEVCELEFGHFRAPKGRPTPALGNAQGLRNPEVKLKP